MKVTTGGGGIDADGNWYQLPAEEIEVADSFFQDFRGWMAEMDKLPKTFTLGPEAHKLWKAALSEALEGNGD